jgi:hypothetical protein
VEDSGTPGCHDDGKALDSCLLPSAQAEAVGAVFTCPLHCGCPSGEEGKAGSPGRFVKLIPSYLAKLSKGDKFLKRF